MRKIFIDKINNITVLSGEEHRHLSYVLRARLHDEVVLCPQDGYDYFGKIIKINKDETHIEIIKKEPVKSEPQINVDLFAGVLKGDKFELIVQKATELGVNKIYPLISKYSVVTSQSVNILRLNKISLEAAKQSGRGKVPSVEDCVNINNIERFLKQYDAVIFAYEKEENYDIKSALSSIKNLKNVAVIAGCEGGFSDSEAELLKNLSAVSVTLGKRILRAETAAIALLTIIMYQTEQFK